MISTDVKSTYMPHEKLFRHRLVATVTDDNDEYLRGFRIQVITKSHIPFLCDLYVLVDSLLALNVEDKSRFQEVRRAIKERFPYKDEKPIGMTLHLHSIAEFDRDKKMVSLEKGVMNEF